MTGTKELTELLRASGVLIAKCVARSADGNFSRWDGAAVLLSSAGDVWDGIAGMTQIPAEIADMDQDEAARIIAEIEDVLAKSGRFTHRQRDVAARILSLAYHNVSEVAAMLALPPTAEPVP